MKVLLVVHGFPPELAGGTELVCATDAAALARAGCEVVVVSGTLARGEGSVERDVQTREDGVRVVDVDGTPVKLDRLGPIVVQKHGSLKRITNWAEMTGPEQQRTLKVVAAATACVQDANARRVALRLRHAVSRALVPGARHVCDAVRREAGEHRRAICERCGSTGEYSECGRGSGNEG